jgi:hypothetical protein
MTGKTISHYRVLELLGSGGMGVVYRAEDTRLGRTVAIKFLPEDATDAPGQRLERFTREARAASLLNHPHICVIHDVGEHEGRPFLVMELLEGQTLAERLAARTPTADETLRWATQIADGLQAAHHKGIIHRDIKPANVFITERGDAKILDFGLAKFTASSTSGADPTMVDSVRTQGGQALGTVAYMAPEQVRGEDIDARADIFALGIVMYELAGGRRPFAGATSGVIFDAILNRTPDPISSDPELGRVVFKALEKDRTLRYQTADDLLADLRRLQRDSGATRSGAPPVPNGHARARRTAAVAIIAAVGLIGAAAAAWIWLRPDAAAPPAAELKPVRLTANPSEYPVSGAALSPDGKLLAYSDPRGIQLLVVASNETQPIPETQGIVVVGWSDDGTRVLGHRQAGGEAPTHWSISILGAGGRRPMPMAGLTSPDGRSTLVFKEDYTAWIESANGQRPLASLKLRPDPDATGIMGLDWTPDSRRLLALRGTADGARELVAIDPVADRLDILLSSEQLPRFAQSMKVVDPNRVILTAAELRGSDRPTEQTDRNFWEARLDRQDPARRMTNWTGFNIQSVSVTPDGRRLTFLQTKYQEDVWVAGLEAGNTRLVNPRRLTLDDRNDRPFGWTADSRAVLFSSNRSGTTDLLVQDALRDAAPQTLAGGPGSQSLARATADGKWVLFIDMGPPRRLMRVATAGATPEEVGRVPNLTGIRCGLAPASPCLIDEDGPDQQVARLVDPMLGPGETLFSRPPSNFAPAPAFDRFGYVLPPKAGAPRNIIQLVNRAGVPQGQVNAAGATMLNSLDYAADGKGFFTSDYSTDLGARLLYVSLSGATTVLWNNRASVRTWGVPSPDGKWVAMLVATQESNVWVLDGF